MRLRTRANCYTIRFRSRHDEDLVKSRLRSGLFCSCLLLAVRVSLCSAQEPPQPPPPAQQPPVSATPPAPKPPVDTQPTPPKPPPNHEPGTRRETLLHSSA